MGSLALIAIVLLVGLVLFGAVASFGADAEGPDDTISEPGAHWLDPEGAPFSDDPLGFAIAGALGRPDGESLASHGLSFDDAAPDPWQSSIGSADFHAGSSVPWINPATGLPMISDSPAGVDVGGNLYGSNNDDLFNRHDTFGHGIGLDSWNSHDSLSSFGSGADWS